MKKRSLAKDIGVKKLWFEVWTDNVSRGGGLNAQTRLPHRYRNRKKAEAVRDSLKKMQGIADAWLVEVWRL